METRIFSLSSDYSLFPGPRYITEGPFSGEDFRKNNFLKIVEECIEKGQKLTIDLDGTNGYGTSFLEETFGGLIRENGYSLETLVSLFEFKSDEEPYLIDDIKKYMKDAWESKKSSKRQ